MGNVIIADFGVNDRGIQTFRVNGSRKDIEKLLRECHAMGHKFFEEPEIKQAYKMNCTVLLQIILPPVLKRVE